MKKHFIFTIMVVGILLLNACRGSGSADQNTQEVASSDSEKIAVADARNILKITVCDSVKKGEVKASYLYNIDIPKMDNDALYKNICEWINESLGGDYSGNVESLDSLFRFYGKNFLTFKDEDMFECNMSDEVSVKKTMETDRYITLEMVRYSFSGGAHGMHNEFGITFRKVDGRRFDSDMLRFYAGNASLTDMLKTELFEQYFKEGGLSTVKEMEGSFLIGDRSEFPLPTNGLYLTEKGVTFYYQPYEIACYAAGSPACTISYEKMKPFLKATVASYIQ